jgi:hypothetical protein
MIFTRKFLKVCVAVIIFLSIANLIYLYKNKAVINNFTFKAFKNAVNEKISWEDLMWINYEKTRIGPGEHGEQYIEKDPELIKKNDDWVKKEGFYVEVSNLISVTRALPDNRPQM